MKRFLLLLIVVCGVFAYYNRERLFLRDPMGSVTRGGVKEDGAQVFINFSNDVLLENDNPPMYFNLVEHGEPVSAPDGLKCFHWLMCLANGYPVPHTMVLPGAKLESMTDRQVTFRDSAGREVVVKLR